MKSFFLVWLFWILSSSAFAEEPTGEIDASIRSWLTGDWGGLRTDLADRGLSLEVEHTSTYQGLAFGTGNDDFEFGSKFDVFLNLDSSKLGLWKGGGLRTHFEYRQGEANAFRGGALWPVNTAQVLPLGASEEIVASSLYLTQKIGDSSSVLFGKINVVDLLASDSFFGGWGNRRFMNVAFVAPPSGVLPPVIFGAIVNVKTGPVTWTAMGYEPNDRTTEYIPDELFADGQNFSLSGTYSGKLAGRVTKYNLGAIYSTKESPDLSDFLLPPNLERKTKKGSYNISFQFSHYLQESSDGTSNGWGVFVKTGITDGNPNPIQAYATGGIGGSALFLERPQDSFGLGYFYYAFSGELKNGANAIIELENEQGLEAFYSYAVTPWLNLTGDIQYIDPALSNNKNELVVGIRMNTRF